MSDNSRSDPRRPVRFDAARRAAYLDLVRSGGRRQASARAVGVCPRAVRRAMHTVDGELSLFGGAVHEAEMEANEAMENALWTNGVVHMSVVAQQVWLYNRMPDQWRDMRRAEIVINAEMVDAEIRRLTAELERRHKA